jgi:BlaI family transcriptional regulator, penicillinase repressor
VKSPHNELTRRERQIMDVLFRTGQATASEVQAGMPDPPSYSAVRAMLRVLEEKGHVRHEQDGPRYLYKPSVARERAKKSAMRHLLHTFFEGSHEQAVAALLDEASTSLSREELDRLASLIEKRRKEGAAR